MNSHIASHVRARVFVFRCLSLGGRGLVVYHLVEVVMLGSYADSLSRQSYRARPSLGYSGHKKCFFPAHSEIFSIVGILRDQRAVCSALDRQILKPVSNFETSVWLAVSPNSSYHPKEVCLAQFSLYAPHSYLDLST